MTEIFVMNAGHEYWDATTAFAESCSWRAGRYLAELMRGGGFAADERVLSAFEDGEPAGFCTFSRKDELPEKYDFTPFIGFVFVDEKHRGKRLSERMINAASEYARTLGYERIFIMSGEIGLYEKYGFEKLGDYETIYGTVDQLFVRSTEI